MEKAPKIFRLKAREESSMKFWGVLVVSKRHFGAQSIFGVSEFVPSTELKALLAVDISFHLRSWMICCRSLRHIRAKFCCWWCYCALKNGRGFLLKWLARVRRLAGEQEKGTWIHPSDWGIHLRCMRHLSRSLQTVTVLAVSKQASQYMDCYANVLLFNRRNKGMIMLNKSIINSVMSL